MKTLEKDQLDIRDLVQEVVMLRSFVIGMAGKDSEGEYQAEFVTRILAGSKEKIIGSFNNSAGFIKMLQKHED